MQTFLPFSDFKTSLYCLDDRRLGKQRLEADQAIQILSGNGKLTKNGKVAYANHPTCLQWAGFLDSLKLYFNLTVKLWVAKGYNNNYSLFELPKTIIHPPWLGYEPYHSSHRASLLFKKYEHYSQFGWAETPKIEYFWPSKDFKKEI